MPLALNAASSSRARSDKSTSAQRVPLKTQVRVLADIDEASVAAAVSTGDAVARVVRAAFAVLQEQLTLRLLLALLADPRSGFPALLAVLGQHVVHFAVAFVLHARGPLDDALVVAAAVFVQL